MIRKLGVPALVAALVALFMISGARGVDLGDHWDEVEWHLTPVREMVTTGVFLPHAYAYPALSKWLVLMPALPRAAYTALVTQADPASIKASLTASVGAADYLLRARLVFVVMSGLAVLWVYCAARAYGRKQWEAFFAACCLGLSWEYAYHARWVANDCILTQFAALTLFLVARFRGTRRAVWLYLAAVSVGLGTGAKSPGVVLLVPLVIIGLASRPRGDLRGKLGRMAALCLVAFAAYLVTTPGTLVEPFTFLKDSHRISAAYQGTHYGYTVLSFWNHIGLVLTYLAVSYFSPFTVVAVGGFLATLWGGFVWARQDRRAAALLVGFPILYLAFFCRYHIMIVRNYLLLTPFLALLAARGVADALERVRHVGARRACGAALATLAVVQAIWLVRAGEGIRHHDMKAYARDAMAYVAARPGTTFRVSPGVRRLAAEEKIAMPPNVVDAPAGDHAVFFGRAEYLTPWQRKTNDPWLTEAVFGPREININWYSTWEGRDRVLVMAIQKAREAKVPLAQ